jgi:TonB family protein
MSPRILIFLLALLTVAASAAPAQDSDTSQQGRRVVRKVTPVYPDLAKQMQISGVVKLRATVAPRGSVKSIVPMGGSPLLIKAAQDAVRDWKYAPAPDETRELIELRFSTK